MLKSRLNQDSEKILLDRPLKQVLLVDDDFYYSKMLQVYLKKFDLQVEYFSKPPANFLNQVIDLQPDLILLDGHLGNGIKGLDLLKILRQSSDTRCIPVAMVTGDTCEHYRRQCLIAGADDYLIKPVGLCSLQRLVTQYLQILPKS